MNYINIEAEYQKRTKRVADCVALKESDKVPFIPVLEAFPVYYGGKTIKECMYDYKKTVQAKKELKDIACIVGNLPNYLLLSYDTYG